jgi:UDP-2-acetamido-2-deoxy-ribo-hexuluronate aminotransferase
LLEKLKVFDDEIVRREAVAAHYQKTLQDLVKVPLVAQGNNSVWAQYTVRLPDTMDRQRFAATLKGLGIPTMIYYERPMHQQTAYRHYPSVEDMAASESLSRQAISLPMHPYLDQATQDRVIDAVVRAVG